MAVNHGSTSGLDDSWHIGEISVHPHDHNIVFVSVLGHFWSKNKNRGVYRTLDGGKTGNHVLAIDEKTGSNDIVISKSILILFIQQCGKIILVLKEKIAVFIKVKIMVIHGRK